MIIIIINTNQTNASNKINKHTQKKILFNYNISVIFKKFKIKKNKNLNNVYLISINNII